MGNRSLFGFFIEVILLALGIYVIILNVISISSAYQLWHHYSTEEFSYNFNAWHNINGGFKGFDFLFDKLSTFPGPKHSIEFIEELTFYGNFKENAPADLIEWVRYIGNIIIFPIRFTVTIFADILNNIFWFIDFIR